MKQNKKISGLFYSFLAIIFLLVLSSCEQNELDPPIVVDPGSCDTTKVTFTTFVGPKIKAQCEGCHNSGMALAGINLEGYDKIAESAKSGKLVKSIDGGTMFVYLNSDLKEAACDLMKIKAWVNQGYKNN